MPNPATSMPAEPASFLLSSPVVSDRPAVGFADGPAVRIDAGLLEELQMLREEAARWRAVEAELMQLLGTSRPDRIIHDVRNLLQERIFLIAACRDTEAP